MAYANSELIKQCPIEFTYIFVTKDYLSAIARAFSQAHATNIKVKYDNAIRYVSGWGKEQGLDYEAAKKEVYNLIVEQYDKTPYEILVGWAQGKNFAGKDFSKGVYGVGATPQLTFNQDPHATVNPNNGTITWKGVDTSPEAMWKTVDTNNKTVEMNYTLGGKTYTSRYNPSTGKFMANTYGTKDAMQYANGTTYKAKNAATTWENINTALPAVSSFMEWLANVVSTVVGKFTPIGQMAPAQEDYYKETSPMQAGLGTVGFVLLGSLLIGTALNSKKKR